MTDFDVTEFAFKDIGASAGAVADGLVRAVTAPTAALRHSELRMAELRAVPLPGIQIARATLLATSRLGPDWESALDTALLRRDASRTPRKLRFDGRRWYAVTSIRLLDPVDPRWVWDALSTIIEASVEYRWRRFPPGSEEFGANGVWYADSDGLWYSGLTGIGIDPIGASALAVMTYGGEGSALDESDYADFPQWQLPPPGFVEISLYNGDHDRHDEFAGKLCAWAGGNTAELDHYAGLWRMRPTRSGRD